MESSQIKPKKIGLALGSGSARGIAHVGVIRELEAMGIRPDVVAGTSAGSIVGAVYACGKLDWFESWLMQLKRREMAGYLDTSYTLRGGIFKGRELIDFFKQHVGDFRIEDLQLPFGAVTTSLESGDEIWLTKGPLWDAVRVSIALPVMFTPAKLEDEWMVDGGLVNPVPVSLCRALGAETIIAVNLNHDIVERDNLPRSHEKPETVERFGLKNIPVEKLPLDMLSPKLQQRLQTTASTLMSQYIKPMLETPSLLEVVMGSIHIMQDRITRTRLEVDRPDVVLMPELDDFGVIETERAPEAIEAGRQAVREMADAIRQAVS
jgi:NTE family protein